MPITRRQLLAMGAAAATGANPAAAQPRRSLMGVGSASYMFRIMTERRGDPRARTGSAGFFETLNFIDYCHSLGAGGVQCALTSNDSGYTKKVRQNCEEYGMYFEASLNLPQTEADVDSFNDALKAVRQAGASVVRAVMLTGRRYETFDSLAAWDAFVTQSWKRLTLAEPALRKQKMFLALENHKDWRIDEMLGILQRISSEYVGVCVDVGNNIALLEDPLELTQAFAPYAKSVHLKDMALEAYDEGFLLSEVPFGAGYLDLKRIVEILRQANPAIQILMDQAEEAATEGEIPPELIQEINDYLEAFRTKVDRIAGYWRWQESIAEICGKEADRLAARKKAAEGRLERLKGMLLAFMLSRGAKKLEGERAAIGLQANGMASLVIDNSSQLGECFFENSIRLTKAGLRELVCQLADGELRRRLEATLAGNGWEVNASAVRAAMPTTSVPGARLVKGHHVRLR